MDEEPDVIIPQYKMIFAYDIATSSNDSYLQFVLGEMIPAMQEMGVYMTEAWHTGYGEYPLRMVVFVAEDIETIQSMLASDRWEEIEGQFMTFVKSYTRKVISYRQGFQFIQN
jgi:hypothetical protein